MKTLQQELDRLKKSVNSDFLNDKVRPLMQRRIAELEAELTAVNSRGGADVRFQATETQPENQSPKPSVRENQTIQPERQQVQAEKRQELQLEEDYKPISEIIQDIVYNWSDERKIDYAKRFGLDEKKFLQEMKETREEWIKSRTGKVKPKPVVSYAFEHAPETEQRVIVSANLTDRFAKVMDSEYFDNATDLNRVVARRGFQTLLSAFRAKKEQIEAEAERLGVKLSIQTQDCYPRYYEASDDDKASADLLFNLLIKHA